ncbi:DUF3365 domain-containing protein [Paraglaciecola sp. L3A3]|uniref:Tll0287-like domain-containing protein n=1 Tax=Paraglaciecola sp. L3A3 TaxID=2686358 RepID=UPI00131B9BA9|nr:DUF3365 domain-containing protein [Paraglaciecola sp. L3A3]
MKLLFKNMLLAHSFIVLPALVSAAETMPSTEIQQARTLVKAFGGDLKQVLQSAMQTGGPIKGLTVCNLEAEPIAEKHSSSSWDIARTSLKVRNQNNQADAWETTVLQQFIQRQAAGEDLATMEHSEVVTSGDKTLYRYMKPIPTAGVCLTCHGVTLSNDVSKKIKTLYPDDQATGFNLGDIRGAFTLSKVITP